MIAEKVFKMPDMASAIEFLEKAQTTKPFDCPHLLVAKKRFMHGRTTFEEGDILCKSGFLDVCSLFNRCVSENGRIIAKCRKTEPEITAEFRKG